MSSTDRTPLVLAAAVGALAALVIATTSKTAAKGFSPKVPQGSSSKGSSSSVIENVGSTPLFRLKSFDALGLEIICKAEYLNPGGSIKDRAALRMIQDAKASGLLKPGGLICEGTGGNTGIGLALLSSALGHPCFISCPFNISQEKINLMKALGADVHLCPTGIKNDHPDHYTQVAKEKARTTCLEKGDTTAAVHTDQFANSSNFAAHYENTGPEIFSQCDGKVDGFCCSAGTGGTIAGVSAYLKSADSTIQTFLVDCQGSGMKKYLSEGVFGKRESDTLFHGSSDTVAEGVGISRLTKNFAKGVSSIDGALSVTDLEACRMCFWLLKKEGIFVGISAAMNVVGALKLGLKLRDENPNQDVITIATILCDAGENYVSKVYNEQWRKENNLEGVDVLPESVLVILDGKGLDGGPIMRGEDILFANQKGGS